MCASPDEFAGPLGYIVSAILIPLGELAGRDRELSHDRQIVAACRAGSRSAQAISILQQNGFTDIADGRLAALVCRSPPCRGREQLVGSRHPEMRHRFRECRRRGERLQ
jgi:hypothetical protein